LTPSITIRKLEQRDAEAAAALSAEAGWNQTILDWNMLLKLAPSTCFGIERDGQLAATTTLLCYGERLAWLGMVLTRQRYQKQGFARRLLEHALEAADRLRIQTIKLDATGQGQPIYEKLGFRVEQVVQRWSGGRISNVTELIGNGHYPQTELADFDRQVFGADRAPLLTVLSEGKRSLQTARGFLCHRTGLGASYLGPCIAETHAEAEQLIRTALPHGQRWYWDILAENERAEQLATSLGFTIDRTLRRMLRGDEQRQDSHKIYAIAGFELG
jgi:GNAT superfamily N-acetyltransferase